MNAVQNTYFQYILCNGGGTFRRPPFRRRRLGAADSALDNSAPSRFDAGHFGAVSYIYFFSSYEAGNFLNAVEREPVETRVLNPIASEASYKPKQRSIQKNESKKKVLAPDSPGAQMSGAEMSSAQAAAPKRTRPHIIR